MFKFCCQHFKRQFAQSPLPEISFLGWIKSIHKLKNKTFIKIQDGRSPEFIQIVFNNEMIDKNLMRDSCVKVFGNVVDSIGKGQSRELRGLRYEILSANEDEDEINANNRLFSTSKTGLRPDIAKKDLLHLRHRLDHYAALARIRAGMKSAIRTYLFQNNYLEVDPPNLTNVDCEGAGETFRVVVDGIKDRTLHPRLSVSAQLHLEALVLGLSDVYSLGPVFRANQSLTRHHLAEFVMLEAESVRLVDEESLCAEIEALIRHVTQWILDTQQMEVAVIEASNIVTEDSGLSCARAFITEKPFTRISFDDAVCLLADNNEVSLTNQKDFSKSQEQRLVQLTGGGPLFLTSFPSHLKPFYTKVDDRGRCMAVDLLLPGVGEIAGGTVREDGWERLRHRMRITGVNEEHMKWYLDLRKGGGCPHGGYGLGLDRLVQVLTGVSNITDVVTFPRTYATCVL